MGVLPSPPAQLAKPLEEGRGGGRPLPPQQRGPLKLDQGGGPSCWLLGEAPPEPPGHPSIEGPAVLDQRCHENLLRQCEPWGVVPRARAGATRAWVLGPSLASVGPGALAAVWQFVVGLAQRCPLPCSWGWSARFARPLLLSWTGETPIPRLSFLLGVWGGQTGPGSRPRGSPGISHLLRVLLTAEALSPAGSARREASATLGCFCCLLLPGSRATRAGAETRPPLQGGRQQGTRSRWPPGPLPRPQLGVAGACSPWYLCPEGEGRKGSPAGPRRGGHSVLKLPWGAARCPWPRL